MSYYSSVVLADNPIRYYRLGDQYGTIAVDIGSQAQNGTPHGVVFGQNGLIANESDTAAKFNGTSGYISLPTTGLPTAAPWSLEAWITIALFPSHGHFGTFLGLGTGGNSVELCYKQDGRLAIIANGGSGAVAAQTWLLSPNTIYHVVATYDGSTLLLYVNGVQVASVALSGYTIIYGNGDSSAGAIGAGDGPGDYFNGVIDEACIYNYALIASQVAAHYAGGLPLPPTNITYFVRGGSGLPSLAHLTDDYSPVEVGDTNAAHVAQFLHADGTPVSLAGATFALKMQNEIGTVLNCTGAWTIQDATNGKAAYSYQTADLATAGDWLLYPTITIGGKPLHADPKKLTIVAAP